MEDKPSGVLDMIRRALSAQVEMGLDEVIVDRARLSAAAERPPAVDKEPRIVPRETEPTAVDLFGKEESGPTLAPPQYESLEAHRAAICECQGCPLGATRNKFVYGAGNPHAGIMFVGEAPGAQEDLQGEPFVGRAGQLLDKILAAINLSRQDVYIANILKCRPPNNRDPQPDEMAKCTPYLLEQMALIRPHLLCALGRVAAQALLETTAPLGKLRGRWHSYAGLPLLATYHPAALLRNPNLKRGAWEDVQELKRRLDEVTGVRE